MSAPMRACRSRSSEASAYFATDFFAGAAHLVAALLDKPDAAYADIFASEPRFQPDAVTTVSHADLEGLDVLLHHSSYFEGVADYWYAFAGDPAATFSGEGGVAPAWSPEPVLALTTDGGYVTGEASNYSHTSGWEGRPTVALPLDLGGGTPDGAPQRVLVCADRCVTLPVVDSCPCYVGTVDQRVANLSFAAWRLVSDAPLEEGLIQVQLYLDVGEIENEEDVGRPARR